MEETIEGLPKDFELRSREFQFSGVLVVHGSSHKRTVFLLSDYILSCQKNRVGVIFFSSLIYFFFLFFFLYLSPNFFFISSDW